MAEIIFGIDHGNGNMKGSNVDFPCGLVRYTSEPGRFMNEDILEYQGTFYTLSETRMPFKADKTVDEDYFILTLFALALEAKSRGITLSGKDIVLGIGLPPADFGQQAPGFKRYFMEHSKHGISFKFNGKSVNCYLKDTFVSPQNFAAVMCYKASLFKQYRTVNCIDIGDGTVDLLVIRKGQPDLSVRVSDRSGMAILRSEISNVIQQNFGIHLESSDVEQVLMQEATILDEEVIREIQKMAEDWMQRITNKLHAYVPDFRTNPAVFLGGGSLLLKPQIEKSPDFKYIEFIEDVRANAIGYEKLTAMRNFSYTSDWALVKYAQSENYKKLREKENAIEMCRMSGINEHIYVKKDDFYYKFVVSKAKMKNLTEQECIEELEKFGKYKEFYYVDGVLLDKRRAIECIRRKYYAYEFDFKLCVKFNPKDVVWFCREKRNR